VSLIESEKSGFSVELMDPYSSRSIFYNNGETQLQRMSNIVNHSINRVHHLNRKFSFSENKGTETTLSPYLGSGYYITYSIGTPPFQLYGVIDTGSDNIWFQCSPCKPCTNQSLPIFYPSKSSSYENIPCSSTLCKSDVSNHCSSGETKKCEYSYLYGDKTYSKGDISMETLTLNPNSTSPISLRNVVIGCGYKNQGTLEYVSGIIGLGSKPFSLISQLGSLADGKFSYCLVPILSKESISSKLSFGDMSVVSGPGTVSTPADDFVAFLEAFSVGDQILKLPKSSIANTIIDSGSTLTRLPADVYLKLESIMASSIKLKRVNDPTGYLSLCYKGTIDMLDAPIITAHFRGADVQLKALNTFYQVDREVVCFAFLTSGNSPLVIYGNVAQQNFLVGFDIKQKIASFKPTDCTNH
ncbi:hypothetical protein RYX36_004679, partial [Vicia faba]